MTTKNKLRAAWPKSDVRYWIPVIDFDLKGLKRAAKNLDRIPDELNDEIMALADYRERILDVFGLLSYHNYKVDEKKRHDDQKQTPR